MAIETPYSKLTALIIDDMAVQQTTLRGQLTMLGIAKVDQATSPDDAIRLARRTKYALFLCDYNLNHKSDGQQLFEHLRDQNLLASDALFFMITAENSYASVASASEHKPDAYLLKPTTASDIEDRLRAQLEKRRALQPITERLAKQDGVGAVAACDALLARKDRWFMQALQYKGQALLNLGRHEDAKAVYLAALDARPGLVWAQLGLARAHKAAGRFDEARVLAQDILQSPDGERNLAAYDLMAEALEAQGDPQAAQWVLRDAATVVPSAKRLRLVADSAFRNGDLELARDTLQQVAKATAGAVTAQTQDTLTLAQTLVDLGQAAQALPLLQGLQAQRLDPTLGSVTLAIQAQAQALTGDAAGAAQAVARARENLRQAKADFATVALAKAELVTGHPEAGLKLLERAVSSDHENPRVKQLVRNALRQTGHEDKMDQLVEAAAAGLQLRVTDAKTLFRDSRIDDALVAIEAALKDYPENTGVLLQAAQMNCLSLRLKKQLNASVVERVRLYLLRLDKLMPGNDRVTQMQRYYRETVAALSEGVAA